MWSRGTTLAQVLLTLALYVAGSAAFVVVPAHQAAHRRAGTLPPRPPVAAPSSSNALVAGATGLLPIVSQRQRVVAHLDPNLYIPEGVHLHSWLGFLGGSVGVFGTLLTYEKGRFKMKQRILCPYCEGSGVITCGACCGCGRTVPVGANNVVPGTGGEAAVSQCATCGGLGVVACVNCKGEGVTVPVVLQRKEMKDVLDEFDLALEEMGIASLAANYANQQARQRLDRITAKAEAQLQAEQAEKDEAAAAAEAAVTATSTAAQD